MNEWWWQFGDVESGVCTKDSVSYANQYRMRNSMKIQFHNVAQMLNIWIW